MNITKPHKRNGTDKPEFSSQEKRNLTNGINKPELFTNLKTELKNETLELSKTKNNHS